MNRLSIWAAAMALAFTTAVTTQAETYRAQDIAREASKVKIDDVIDLPIAGMRAVQSNGELMFISANGRFAFKGKMYDIWNQDQYSTIKDIEGNAFRVSLEKMNIDVGSLNTISIGDGKEEVTIFIDPYCPYCHSLTVKALELQDQYTFHFVFISLLGDRSDTAVAQALCAKNKDEVIPAMLSKSLASLELVSRDKCASGKIAKTSTSGQILGMRGVPYMISPNGTVKQGLVPNLSQWLNTNK